MPPVHVPGVDNVALLTGPAVLGYMWSYFFYGIVVVQLYLYCGLFPEDPRGIKILVAAMFILETCFTVFMTIAAWNAFGPGWGNTDTLEKFDWSWDPLGPLDSLLACMAQGFYIWRIWGLTRKIWLPIFIASISLMQFIMTIYWLVREAEYGRRRTGALSDLSTEITVWLAGSAACDIIITISIVTILYRRRTMTTFEETTSLLSRLMRFSVETGLMTSAGAILELVLVLCTLDVNFYYIPFLCLGRLYSNALLATLNFRSPLFKSPTSSVRHSTGSPPPSSFWTDTQTTNQITVPNLPKESAYSGGVGISRTRRGEMDHEMRGELTKK